MEDVIQGQGGGGEICSQDLEPLVRYSNKHRSLVKVSEESLMGKETSQVEPRHPS